MFPVDRREFLNTAALSAAIAALNVPSAIAADEPRSAGSTAPGERLRIAVVGVNGRGKEHVRGFLNQKDCEIVTICDCDEAVITTAMKDVEKKQGHAPHYEKDVRKVVEDKNIDIVTIATPNHWHSLIAIWAMQNGKDVYVEKPISHNIFEGRRVVQVARETSRICQAGTQSRSMTGMQAAIAAVHSGKIGTVKLAYGSCYKPRGSIGKTMGDQPTPKTMDYDLWCGPSPLEPLHRKSVHYNWHWIWNTGNGDLGNQGIHEMDKARWGLNKAGLPKTVKSVGGRFGYIDDGQTANTQLCIYDYGDAEIIFEVRGLSTGDFKGAKVGNVFFGSEGYIVCPSYSSGAMFDADGKKVQSFSGDGDHFANFLKAVRSRKQSDLHADIEEGHLSSALCHLGNISYRLGAETTLDKVKDLTSDKDALEAFARMKKHLEDNKVDLSTAIGRAGPLLAFDSKSERFTGGGEEGKKANTMLTREYRKGFEIPGKKA